MSDPKVTINGTEYSLSSLRCKHLRLISQILADGTKLPSKGVYGEIEKWMPFLADSIKVKTPNFDVSLLDELTLQEFNDAWSAVVSISSIKVVSNPPQIGTVATETPATPIM